MQIERVIRISVADRLTNAEAKLRLKRPRIGRCRCGRRYCWEEGSGITLYGTRTPCCDDVFYRTTWRGLPADLLEEARLTDAEALAQLSTAARRTVKRLGFVRCLRHPNAWHLAKPNTPGDFGNSAAPHAGPCSCRAAEP